MLKEETSTFERVGKAYISRFTHIKLAIAEDIHSKIFRYNT